MPRQQAAPTSNPNPWKAVPEATPDVTLATPPGTHVDSTLHYQLKKSWMKWWVVGKDYFYAQNFV